MSIDTPTRRPRLTLKPRPAADSAPTDPPAAAIPSPPRLPGRRNPRWIALGVAALCLGGLLSYVIYAKVAAQTGVVAVARTVHRGAVIQSADLTTVTVSGAVQLDTVPAAQLPDLIGRRAAYDLVSGSLLPSAAIAADPVPANGRAVVGLKLAPGRAPAGLLPPSAPLRLVALPPADQAPGTATGAAATHVARVIDASAAADGTSVLLNVEVAANDAPAITLLAAQDRIAVLRDADK